MIASFYVVFMDFARNRISNKREKEHEGKGLRGNWKYRRRKMSREDQSGKKNSLIKKRT